MGNLPHQAVVFECLLPLGGSKILREWLYCLSHLNEDLMVNTGSSDTDRTLLIGPAVVSYHFCFPLNTIGVRCWTQSERKRETTFKETVERNDEKTPEVSLRLHQFQKATVEIFIKLFPHVHFFFYYSVWLWHISVVGTIQEEVGWNKQEEKSQGFKTGMCSSTMRTTSASYRVYSWKTSPWSLQRLSMSFVVVSLVFCFKCLQIVLWMKSGRWRSDSDSKLNL